MKAKYWYLLGGAAVLITAVGFYAHKHDWFVVHKMVTKDEMKSGAAGGCPNSDGSPPATSNAPGGCAEYVWNASTCDWECDLWWDADGWNLHGKGGIVHKPTARQIAARQQYLHSTK